MHLISGRLVLTAALSAALIGCGGGGDSDPDPTPELEGPTILLVDGDMKSVNVTGKNFQSSISIFEASESNSCEASTAYFETANMMAYSAASHTERELQEVASTVEYAMSDLIEQFGFENMAEFMDRKRRIAHRFLDGRAHQLTGLSDTNSDPIYLSRLSDYFAANPPGRGFTGWDDPYLDMKNAETALMRSALIQIPSGAKAESIYREMITKAKALTGLDFPFVESEFKDSLIHDKIQVCVLPDGMKGKAEGHSIGLNITANEKHSFYEREGALFIQKQFADKLPRWVSIGQAVVFADQFIASSRDGKDVVKILSFSDQQESGLYDYYGLAYKALANHQSVSDIMAFIQEHDVAAEWEIDLVGPKTPELQLAEKAWSEAFPGWISYEEFGNNYDTLAK